MLRAPFLETILAANLKSSKSGPGFVVVNPVPNNMLVQSVQSFLGCTQSNNKRKYIYK